MFSVSTHIVITYRQVRKWFSKFHSGNTSLRDLPRLLGAMAKALDCSLEVASSNSGNLITFTFGQMPLGKIWNTLISLQMGEIVSLLSFSKDGFGIK